MIAIIVICFQLKEIDIIVQIAKTMIFVKFVIKTLGIVISWSRLEIRNFSNK